MSRCIGYGPFDNRRQNAAHHCPNEADTPAGLWCKRCEALRRAKISKQFREISRGFRR